MKKIFLFLLTVFIVFTSISCKMADPPVQDAIKYVCIYYDLASDDAMVNDYQHYSEENKMYFTKIAEGNSDYELLTAYRTEYVLVGWLKEDGTEFKAGTPVYNDMVLTAKWVDKNDTPLV